MSNQINDGGPAFPATVQEDGKNGWPEYGVDGTFLEAAYEAPGMTLRDYFAAKAIAAILSCTTIIDEEGSLKQFDFDRLPEKMHGLTEMAETSYEVADAMLLARKTATP